MVSGECGVCLSQDLSLFLCVVVLPEVLKFELGQARVDLLSRSTPQWELAGPERPHAGGR